MLERTLPTILGVSYIPAKELIISPKQLIVPGDIVTGIGVFTPFKMVEPASCTTTSERTENGLVYTTSVQGFIVDDGDIGTQHRLSEQYHCYRLIDVYKNRYLVGIDESPYPEIEFTPTNDSSPSGRRAVGFSITWVSKLPPIDDIEL
jgi:hypothetical protein